MQAEISHFVLIAAALCAVFLSLPTLLGSKSRAPLFVHLWKPALGITFAGLSFALIMLIWAFLTNDFSIAYVANNSNTKLDPVYKISAVWGSHEGSMLLWVWTITVWASLFAVFSRDDELFKSRVLGVLLGVTGLICLFLIFTSNPFERLLPLVPPEGKDLNPILQDIGMILHPPMLFLGYAGTVLCFAFGLGALMEGKAFVYPLCYKEVEILDMGPLRFSARMVFAPVQIGQDKDVVETRVITLDKGTHLNKCEVTYANLSEARKVAAGIAVHKSMPDAYVMNKKLGYVACADAMDHPEAMNGLIYIACLFPEGLKSVEYVPMAKEEAGAVGHVVGVSNYEPGDTFTYYFGSAWSKYDMPDMAVWQENVERYGRQLKTPLAVTLK